MLLALSGNAAGQCPLPSGRWPPAGGKPAEQAEAIVAGLKRCERQQNLFECCDVGHEKPPAEAGGEWSLKRRADSRSVDQPNLPDVEAIRKAA
jgi:hypothetical protein